MLVELSGNTIAPATVEKVAELVKDASPELTPLKVKAIADMAESLSHEVAPAGIELVSSMVVKMGPVLSHRETQMISRMAARYVQIFNHGTLRGPFRNDVTQIRICLDPLPSLSLTFTFMPFCAWHHLY